MIEIKPLAEEYRRCHSCMKSEENARLFELLFGTDSPSIQVILCEDCLKKLGSGIMDILTREVKNIKKKEQFIRESKMFEVYAVKIGDVLPSKDYKDIYQKKEYKKEK